MLRIFQNLNKHKPIPDMLDPVFVSYDPQERSTLPRTNAIGKMEVIPEGPH